MKRITIGQFWIAFCCVLTLSCGDDSLQSSNGLGGTKGDTPQNTNNNTTGGGDVDHCIEFGWYNDGHCDESCPSPDPDCGVIACDLAEHARLISEDPAVCATLDERACGDEEQFFNDPTCGCGCIDESLECGYTDPDIIWYSTDIETCSLEIPVAPCPEGYQYFDDSCGCGCAPAPVECPDGQGVFYYSDDPDACQNGLNPEYCEGEYFDIEGCGCGCIMPQVCQNPNDPAVHYVANSPEECAMIDFTCNDGQVFFDDCGCGCIDDPVCSDAVDPNRNYVGHSPEECALIDFTCPPGEAHFFDECGCGCEPNPTCEDPNDPAVHYVGNSVSECAAIDFICGPNQEYFFNDCGCGCIDITDHCPDPNDPDVIYLSQDVGQCAAFGIWQCPVGFELFSDECGCGCVRTADCTDDSECPNGFCDAAAGQCAYPVCGDGGDALCLALPPLCPPGQTPEIVNGCWGDCVDARTCLPIALP